MCFTALILGSMEIIFSSLPYEHTRKRVMI